MKKIIIVFLAFIHFIIIGCGSCNVESRSQKLESNNMKKIALDKKPLPRGVIKAEIQNLTVHNNSINAEIANVIKRGNEAPIVNIGEKITVKFSDNQKVIVDKIKNGSIILIRSEPHSDIWKLFSIEN